MCILILILTSRIREKKWNRNKEKNIRNINTKKRKRKEMLIKMSISKRVFFEKYNYHHIESTTILIKATDNGLTNQELI